MRRRNPVLDAYPSLDDRPRRECPHQNIIHCPLYIAAHDAHIGMHGCDDGKLDRLGCAVTRGMDYASACVAIAQKAPHLMAEIRLAERTAEEKARRDRNARLVGLKMRDGGTLH